MWYSDIATAMAVTSHFSGFALGAVACFSSEMTVAASDQNFPQT